MSYTVLGIDPGGTTGLARLTFGDTWHLQWTECDGFTTLEMDTWLPEGITDAIAIERFVVGRRAARSRNAAAAEKAREIIGVVSQLGYPVIRNNASDVKRWATDRRLSALGFELPRTKGNHARDALRHALYVMHKAGRCPDPLAETS